MAKSAQKVVLVTGASSGTSVRRAVRQAETDSTYRSAFAHFKQQQEKDEASAPTQEPVAHLVARILRDPSPKLRYSVGKVDQRVVIPAKRLLPQRLFEWVLGRVLGLQ